MPPTMDKPQSMICTSILKAASSLEAAAPGTSSLTQSRLVETQYRTGAAPLPGVSGTVETVETVSHDLASLPR